MSTHTLDAEDFISEVRKYPELWDIRSDDYRHPHRRQRAWFAIASTFIDNIDELSASEKINIYKKLHDRWRNIRDSFVKSKKANSKKSYMYATQLYFLNDIYNNKPSSNSETEDFIHDEPTIKLVKREKRMFEEAIEAWQSDDSNVELKKKKTDEFVDSFPDPGSTTIYTEEDEDRSFFNSLLPAVRQFSIDQKLEFRSEVIGIIKRLRADF